jgi:hypothetical protein
MFEASGFGAASQPSGSKLPRHKGSLPQGRCYHPRPEFTQKFTDNDVDTDSTW